MFRGSGEFSYDNGRSAVLVVRGNIRILHLSSFCAAAVLQFR